MPGRTIEQPKSGFALEIDGRLKTEFSTKEGAEHGAIELKRRFPMLQIRIYDAATQSRHDLPGLAASVLTTAGTMIFVARATSASATFADVWCAARTTASAVMSNLL